MKKFLIGFVVVIVLFAIISCFGDSTDSEKANTPSKTEQTKEIINTYGFSIAWERSTLRETVYCLYDPENNVLVTFFYDGRSYNVDKTEGNLSEGLYLIDPKTNEKSTFYYFIRNNGGIYKYYSTFDEYWTVCDVEKVIKLLTSKTKFAKNYQVP